VLNRKSKKWFDGAVGYQIYPRSFYDSNGDGVGDLKGIIEKLDYLAGGPQSLGVEVIWLCPFYKSPMADFGYDISDYYNVDPIFGNQEDIIELVKQAHERGVRVLVDLVANHTSKEHPWFVDSKNSRDSSKRDWYIWRDGKGGQPPNDWLSVFGGSAWQFDQLTNQYYLHSFSVHQPDLNWENGEVRAAVKDIMRFWLDLGVDGFRADAVFWLSKDHRFRNDPARILNTPGRRYDELDHTYSRKGPHLYGYLREMTAVLNEYKDRFMIAEAYPKGDRNGYEYLKFYRYVDHKHLAPFNFEGIYFPWKAQLFKSFIDGFQKGLKSNYLPVYTFGNHDQPRLSSRLGEDVAPTAALCLLTLPGMPFIYYGEELGMKNVQIPMNLRNDPLSMQGDGRDRVRTPMLWDGSANAGFSSNTPWLPVGDGYKELNAKNELARPDSLLNLYRRLIALRNGSDILRYGSYQPLDLETESVFGFIRKYKRQKIAVVINFTAERCTIANKILHGKVILSSNQTPRDSHVDRTVELDSHEGLIIKLG